MHTDKNKLQQMYNEETPPPPPPSPAPVSQVSNQAAKIEPPAPPKPVARKAIKKRDEPETAFTKPFSKVDLSLYSRAAPRRRIPRSECPEEEVRIVHNVAVKSN
jgi:hypothetical protein